MLKLRQIVNDIFTSNTFILFDEEYDYCWLVDIGDFGKVADEIPPGVMIKGLFLTHTHFDHIYGINELHQTFPKCVIYTSNYGREALYDDKKNFSLYHESSTVFEGKNVVTLKDGDTIELYSGINATVHETPGHCPSCLTFIIDNWVFTGDAYIPGVKVVTKLPKGDRMLAEESVKKIQQLSVGKLICPGHGEITSRTR